MSINRPAIRLFPNYFKKLGLLVVVLVALSFFYVVIVRPPASQHFKELTKAAMLSILGLGLFFIAIAKEKIEDELAQVLRLKAMASAFLFGVIQGILSPIFSLIFENRVEVVNGPQLIMGMLFFYLLIFHIHKLLR